MRPADAARAQQYAQQLTAYDRNTHHLPGIHPSNHLSTLVAQMIDSLRRVEYANWIRNRPTHDPQRMDPTSEIFDPLIGAVLQYRLGNLDEAYWLVFLATHFGKHEKDGWKLTRAVYGRLGDGTTWNWQRLIQDPAQFRTWLQQHEAALKGAPTHGRFSNHRKYESLSASSPKGTAAVVESYISWIQPPRTHNEFIREIHRTVGQNPQVVFHYLYESMDAVMRFGRLAKFDFLAMLGKLGISPIAPDSAYLADATGPQRGARLLFGGKVDAKIPAAALDQLLDGLDQALQVGKQVLEDSLCNWQKSPGTYIQFRG